MSDREPTFTAIRATYRLQFHKGFTFRDATALVSVEREGVLDAFVTQISGKEPIIELPIDARYAPNVVISVLAVRPRWLMHGHLHLSYQRQVDLGGGPIEVTGLDCDGAGRGNWAILDVTSMRWLRFAGRPISNVVRGLVSP